MADDQEYFEYLCNRSALGWRYRKYYLYPRIGRHIHGQTLDVGCGIGDFLAYRPTAIGVDINPKTVEWCRSRGLSAHLMHRDTLPFSQDSFDSAVLDNVLEHLESPKNLLREIHRVLRINGTLVVGVPGRKGYTSDSDHKVFYDMNCLVETLLASDFRMRCLFSTPFQSKWLDRHMSQYCIYGVFRSA